MRDSQATRNSLLVRLRDKQDGQAWPDFVELYAPLVYSVLQRKGLQPADAADVAQDVMRTVFSSLDRFEHNGRPGAFRKWLQRVIHSRFCDFVQTNGREVAGSGDTETIARLTEEPVDENDADIELEYQRGLFRWVADRVRGDFKESTWQAFWLTYVEGHSCEDAAADLSFLHPTAKPFSHVSMDIAVHRFAVFGSMVECETQPTASPRQRRGCN